MEKIFAALLILLSVPSAMADINTVCQGGGRNGKEIRIEIFHILNEVGSQSERVTMNGRAVLVTYLGKNGNAHSFYLQSTSRVYSLDYNQMDATAVLTGQGLNLQLFCSRY
ncbi:hypothetical protein ACLWBD_08485 [Bdellovibrio sp. HCB117]|uniref:hypothetical protein n=1 Tax=Bdellovibrio sp. HCB117 TaxID=3394359 RepID=UPI0039B4EBB5